MTNLSKAAGVYTIASTPFLGDGSIDERSTDRMIDFFLQSEVTGITVLGQMGEAPKLDEQESIGLARRMIRRSSVPVIAVFQPRASRLCARYRVPLWMQGLRES
jgi:4-hydroxy-tetrahydrodipicolinate synthase